MRLFFADPDHSDPAHIMRLCEALPALVKEHKISTIFLEFLFVVTTGRDLREDFIQCSNGRYPQAGPYVRLVEAARRLGLRVVGLTMPLSISGG